VPGTAGGDFNELLTRVASPADHLPLMTMLIGAAGCSAAARNAAGCSLWKT
jgi:hypothetical protein